MSDDRFAAVADPEPEPEHRITMMALLELWFDGHHWQIVEPATLVADGGAVCNRGGHLHDGAAARDRCTLDKQRAEGVPLPSRGAVRDAFDRANRVAL